MKQHINSSQLKEVDFKTVKKLGEMSKVIGYPRTEKEWDINNKKEYLTMYMSLLEFLNIGKMIQILWEKKAHVIYHLHFNGSDEKTDEFESLCDELWKEVKAVI